MGVSLRYRMFFFCSRNTQKQKKIGFTVVSQRKVNGQRKATAAEQKTHKHIHQHITEYTHTHTHTYIHTHTHPHTHTTTHQHTTEYALFMLEIESCRLPSLFEKYW